MPTPQNCFLRTKLVATPMPTDALKFGKKLSYTRAVEKFKFYFGVFFRCSIQGVVLLIKLSVKQANFSMRSFIPNTLWFNHCLLVCNVAV